MQISDEMVEKAMLSLYGSDFYDNWERNTSFVVNREVGMRAALEAALSAAEPVGYLFQMFYPGSKTWSADMFSDHEPTKNLPAEHMRNVRPLYAAPPAPSMAVKDLEWAHGGATDLLYERWEARSLLGPYLIVKTKKGFEWYLDGHTGISTHAALDEAKAAAQADYEARIRSALSAQVQDVAETEADIVERMVKSVRDPFPTVNLSISRGLDGWRELMRNALRAAAPAKQEG